MIPHGWKVQVAESDEESGEEGDGEIAGTKENDPQVGDA